MLNDEFLRATTNFDQLFENALENEVLVRKDDFQVFYHARRPLS